MTEAPTGSPSPPVTLVTGASRGIGRATALALASAGHHVVVAGHGPSPALDAVAATVATRSGHTPLVLHGDVADPAAVGAHYREIFSQHGRLDGLVACAGIMQPGLLGMIRPADIDRSLAVNTAGVLHHLQAASRLMARHDGGSIVLLSSALAQQGVAGNAVYAASKAAVEGIVRAAARELGPRAIRVNAVAPGFVATDMTAALPATWRAAMADAAALPWPVTAEDVAATIVFLLSPAARCVTGQVLGVDAGLRVG